MTSRNHRTAPMACLLLAVSACSKSAAPPPPPPDVVVIDVVQKDVPVYAEWVGTTEGNITAQIRARVQGYYRTGLRRRHGSYTRTTCCSGSIPARTRRRSTQAKAEAGTRRSA